MKKRILVFRFNALGDVAMTIPVMWSFLQKYPDHEIWFVSRPFAADLLAPFPRVHFISVDLKGRHGGFLGLFTLFNELRKQGPWDAVVDLHSVLRSHVLRSLFRITGIKVSKIDKGRKEKRALCRKNNKIFRQLLPTTVRYRDTFRRAGFPFELINFPGKDVYGIKSSKENLFADARMSEKLNHLFFGASGLLIGLAPFAKHHWKMWPEEKMKMLLEMLDEKGAKIVLFGGRGNEQEKLEQWSKDLKNACTFAGQLSMAEELKLMSQLDVMVSMDSANMHLASLAGTRVVSIWGATHPYAGFYGYGQSANDAVQIDLECRPCSVFGNKPCHREDFACMMRISPAMVVDKIMNK